jgi:hypothetical protein
MCTRPILQGVAVALWRATGKITGMLLDIKRDDLLRLLDSPQALSERIEEAAVTLLSSGM